MLELIVNSRLYMAGNKFSRKLVSVLEELFFHEFHKYTREVSELT